jgi:hypothetical protein
MERMMDETTHSQAGAADGADAQVMRNVVVLLHDLLS